MRRFYKYGILTAVMVIGLAAMVAAQPPAGGRGMRGQGMRGQGMGPGPGGGLMAALKLTDEQQKALQAVMQSERDEHQAAMKQVRELRAQLLDALYGDNSGKLDPVTLATQIATLEAQVRTQMQVKAAGILTPEQRKIVLDSGMEFPPAPMGPGGRGGRGGQPPVKK